MGSIFHQGSMEKDSLMCVQLIHSCQNSVVLHLPSADVVCIRSLFQGMPRENSHSGVFQLCVGSYKINLVKSSHFWILHNFELICDI